MADHEIAKRVVSRFLAAAAKPTSAADAKKLIEKLLKGFEKGWLSFFSSLPSVAEGQGWSRITMESRPLHGGYGPYEMGEIGLTGTLQGGKLASSLFTVKLVYDLPKGTLGVGVYSGPHPLEGLMHRGEPKSIPAHLKKVFERLTSDFARKAREAKPPAPVVPSVGEIRAKLVRIDLGPGGSPDDIQSLGAGEWSIEPRNRQRLDHFVGRHYRPGPGDDPEGWDEDGWEEEYAGPVRKAAQKWLDREFGHGMFALDVGDKGYVYIELTPAGKKHFNID